MVFSSVIFLCVFLPIVIGVYTVLPVKFKNIFLLLSSLVFYTWGAPKFVFVILLTTTVDFYIVKAVHNATDGIQRNILFVCSLILNLGLLFYFKYANFFIDNVNSLFQIAGVGKIEWLKVVLPIGISFYTFESVTYMVDVYRRVHKPLDSFLTYQLYILLFPKLIAGPIIRFHEIGDQFYNRFKEENYGNRLHGLYRFILGLAKKVIIANALAVKADEVFNSDISSLSSIDAGLGVLCYTLQIYFDFSGYSEMAIGIGKMLGFKFPENFDSPYTSLNITEFWRRWHITLGTWMRNYLYIPLGGNKVNSQTRLYFNLWIVFLLSGFWHGASWTFIFWGAYHGVFLVLERSFLLKVYKNLGKLTAPLCFAIVSIGWVFFRAETWNDATSILKRIFAFDFKPTLIYYNPYTVFVLVVAIFFSFAALIPVISKLQHKFYEGIFDIKTHLFLFGFCAILFIYSLALITGSNFNPFIYFRF